MRNTNQNPLEGNPMEKLIEQIANLLANQTAEEDLRNFYRDSKIEEMELNETLVIENLLHVDLLDKSDTITEVDRVRQTVEYYTKIQKATLIQQRIASIFDIDFSESKRLQIFNALFPKKEILSKGYTTLCSEKEEYHASLTPSMFSIFNDTTICMIEMNELLKEMITLGESLSTNEDFTMNYDILESRRLQIFNALFPKKEILNKEDTTLLCPEKGESLPILIGDFTINYDTLNMSIDSIVLSADSSRAIIEVGTRVNDLIVVKAKGSTIIVGKTEPWIDFLGDEV